MAHMLAALVAAARSGNRGVTPDGIRSALAGINQPRGQVIRPRPADLAMAAREIARHRRIDYEGASSSLDWDAAGETYPKLVRWKIQSGRFAESGSFRCDPGYPLCTVRP